MRCIVHDMPMTESELSCAGWPGVSGLPCRRGNGLDRMRMERDTALADVETLRDELEALQQELRHMEEHVRELVSTVCPDPRDHE